METAAALIVARAVSVVKRPELSCILILVMLLVPLAVNVPVTVVVVPGVNSTGSLLAPTRTVKFLNVLLPLIPVANESAVMVKS